jgi:hypothetical protein
MHDREKRAELEASVRSVERYARGWDVRRGGLWAIDGTEHAVRTRLKPWKWSAGAPNVTVWNSRHLFGSRPSCTNQTHPAHAPRTRASTRAHERTLTHKQTNTGMQSRSQTNKQTNK